MIRLIATSPALRHGVRTGVAALAASEITTLLGLPQGYWAVITTFIVTQASVGGTLGAALDRVLATLAGAGAAVIGAWLQGALHVPISLVLVAVGAPLAVLGVKRPSFRVAPVTAAIVLMSAGGDTNTVWTALDRVMEIAVGCVIGVLAVQFVLPARARPLLLGNTASLLTVFGSLAEAHLQRIDPERIETLNEQARGLLARIEAGATEESRERAMRLAVGGDLAPLVRTLRRIRSDVAIIGRVMVTSDAANPDAAQAAKAQFDQLAGFVRDGGIAPGLGALDTVIGEQPATGTLHFSLITLRRELAELEERLNELVSSG